MLCDKKAKKTKKHLCCVVIGASLKDTKKEKKNLSTYRNLDQYIVLLQLGQTQKHIQVKFY